MAKKRITMTIDSALVEKMDTACAAQGLSRSAYVTTLITKDLEGTEKFLAQFKELLEQAIGNDVITS